MNPLWKLVKNHPYELLTAAVILVFFLIKLHDVNIPYYWDEMGVYVPAAFHMKDAGHISLLPGSLDPLFSRGHPLLFTFCNALVFKIFGETITVGHLFALFLGIATLVLFFIIAKKLFNKKVAFFATVLLSFQPIFFTLSVQILPEMMLTFFTLVCIYGILKKKWVLFAIFGSLAMLTKESAIVIPLTALILLLIDSIRDKDFFTMKRFRLFLLGTTPLFVFGLFLIIQKIQNGWFLFPEHMGYIHWEMEKLSKGAERIFQDMFIWQGRWMVGASFLAGILLSLFSKTLKIEPKGKIIYTFSLFIFLAFIFADINYYLTRYILYVIPFIIMGGTYTAIVLFEKIFPNLKTIRWGLIILFTGYGVVLGHKNMYKSPDTCDMSYKLVVNVSQQAIHWAEQNWSKNTIETNFPICKGIEDPRYGYLTGKPIPYSVNYVTPTKYGLLFYMWEKDNIPIGKSLKYHIIKTFDDSYAHVVAVKFDRNDPTSTDKE
ncbi:MAG TPA: glycosyltransferase family 39 protein [Bacteroidales bacterium]|nr:glycosyltransferase family 39 protein [Bacteroidales bacterium]